MYGFTESFNVSVCAALCLYELTTRIRETVPNHLLTEDEKIDIYFDWLVNSIDSSVGLIENFYKDKA
jgi:tRNA (guanosine-2'-O-)-methyltransferase